MTITCVPVELDSIASLGSLERQVEGVARKITDMIITDVAGRKHLSNDRKHFN